MKLCQVAAADAPSDADLVGQVAGWSEAQTLEALDELLDHQLIREAPGRSGFDYTFTHHLIQATAYEMVPDDSRTRRHRRVARVMEQVAATPGDEFAGTLALHWDRGGEPARAAESYLRAAHHARAVYADMEALAQIQRALELVDAPRLRADLLGLRETIYAWRGERAAQHVYLLALREIAESTGDADLICDSLRREIHYERALGNRQAEAKRIESLCLRAAQAGLARWQAEALREQATYRVSIGEYESAGPIVERALQAYEALGDAAGLVQCLCLRGAGGLSYTPSPFAI